MTAPQVSVPVLMYHEVSADSRSRLAVPPGAFAAQLAYLDEAGYRTVTAAAYADALAGRGPALPERAVVLTFDDGFADFHSTALPLLQRYGFTATVFVTTGWISDIGPLAAEPRPGPMLSWEQILYASASGVEIAAHSHRHDQLDQLPERVLRRDLAGSKALLEDRLGAPVPGLAYPFGYSNARVRHAVQDMGHSYAYAVGNVLTGPAPDPFILPRVTIRRSTGLSAFGQVVSGHLPPIYLKDRALTRGFAMVRRTRAAARGVSPGAAG
jgi:peptidoglycan/xylan/chitin deacetylase (PgdA/CDA1 family)